MTGKGLLLSGVVGTSRHGRDVAPRYDGDSGLGDRLLAAVLRGEKTPTWSVAVEHPSGEPLPRVGQRLTHLVGDDVALDDSEGFADAEAWRQDHVAFWEEATDPVRADASAPGWHLRKPEHGEEATIAKSSASRTKWPVGDQER